MPTFTVRVWLPDRPGALGAVATSIGSIGGDLTGIEILETGAGRAVDELVVSLPADALVEALVDAMCRVEGVDVEEVRPADGAHPRDALEAAAAIAEQQDLSALEQAIAEQAAHHLAAEWSAVVDTVSTRIVAALGTSPPGPWLAAFVAGSRSAGEGGPDDVAWTELGAAPRALVLGRSGRPFRARERQHLALVGRIAGVRWCEVAAQLAIT